MKAIHYPLPMALPSGSISSLEAELVFPDRLISMGLPRKIRGRKGPEAGYVDEVNRQAGGNRPGPNGRWHDNLDRRASEPGTMPVHVGASHSSRDGWELAGAVVLAGRRRRRRRGLLVGASLGKSKTQATKSKKTVSWNGQVPPAAERSDPDHLVSSWRGRSESLSPELLAHWREEISWRSLFPLGKEDWLDNPTFFPQVDRDQLILACY